MVPFFSLTGRVAETGPEVTSAVQAVLESATYVHGGALDAFSDTFAAYIGCRHAVGTGNGLDALRIILEALGIGPGDEVIVPALTFVATALAVQHAGAIPVLADVDEHGLLEPAAVLAAISPRTAAVIAVHLWGRPAEMDVLRRVADKHGLALIEDAAQAHGAVYQGQRTGSLADAAAFSFYPTKNLGGIGDGGMVTTSDAELAARVRQLGNYGAGPDKYRHDRPGWNSRLDPIQAAALSVFLPRLDEWNTRRAATAIRYTAALTGLHITAPAWHPGHAWHHYVVQAPDRDRLRDQLAGLGIGTDVHYPVPLHRSPAVRGRGQDCPQADRLASSIASLPMHPWLGPDVDRVADALTDLGGRPWQ